MKCNLNGMTLHHSKYTWLHGEELQVSTQRPGVSYPNQIDIRIYKYLHSLNILVRQI